MATKSSPAPKRASRSQSHPTIRVVKEVHTRLGKLRDDNHPTFGNVVQDLLDTRDLAEKSANKLADTLASTVGISLSDPMLAKRRLWFTPQDADAPGMEALRSQEISGADLIDIAARTAGVPLVNFVRFAALQLAKTTILEDYRIKAGATNATGVSNSKLAEAFTSLVAAGVPITPSRLRERAGTNSVAATRWLLLHHPEVL